MDLVYAIECCPLYPFLSFSFWVDLHSIRCISSAIPYSKIEEEEGGKKKRESKVESS